jgi:hypothetical protein
MMESEQRAEKRLQGLLIHPFEDEKLLKEVKNVNGEEGVRPEEEREQLGVSEVTVAALKVRIQGLEKERIKLEGAWEETRAQYEARIRQLMKVVGNAAVTSSIHTALSASSSTSSEKKLGYGRTQSPGRTANQLASSYISLLPPPTYGKDREDDDEEDGSSSSSGSSSGSSSSGVGDDDYVSGCGGRSGKGKGGGLLRLHDLKSQSSGGSTR